MMKRIRRRRRYEAETEAPQKKSPWEIDHIEEKQVV
jgi:hypothetical protein